MVRQLLASKLEPLIWSILCGAALLSGSVHIEIVAGLLAFISALFLLLVSMSRDTKATVPRTLLLVLIALCTVTSLYVLPISADVLKALSLETFLQFDQGYRGLALPEFLTLSLDPTLSFHRFVQYLALLGLCGLLAFNQTSDRERWEQSLIWCSVILLGGFAMMEIVSWRPWAYSESVSWRGFGPFINPNHAGAFGTLLALWLLHAAQKTSGYIRWVGLLMAFVYVGVVAATLSRGSILALTIGLCFGTGIPVVTRRGFSRPTTIILICLLGLFMLLLYFERASLIPLMRELLSLRHETGDSKITPWLGVPELLMAYPFGTGPGGLYPGLPQVVSELSSNGRVFFLENQFLQLFTDWGMWIGLGLLLAFLSFFKNFIRRSLIKQNPFFYAGLLALAIQNTVDFSLSVFAIQAWVVAGLFMFIRFHSGCFRWTTLRTSLVVSGAAVVLLVVVAGAQTYGLTGMKPRFDSLKSSLESAESPSAVKGLLIDYKRQHPLDVFGDLIVARKLVQLKAPSSEVFSRVNVAMWQHPHFAEPHILASQILASYGARSQAIGEFIRAYDKNPHVTKTQSGTLIKVLSSPELAERAQALNAESRYELWSYLRAHGVFLPELILQDEDWLETSDRIHLRSMAHLKLKDPRSVLDDCSRWRQKYPALQACRSLEFSAFDALGKQQEVLVRLRDLRLQNRYRGDILWQLLSRLNGKEGCRELLQIIDDDGQLIQFSDWQRMKVRQKVVRCLVVLDYRNRFRSTKDSYLSDERLTPEVLDELLTAYREFMPVAFYNECQTSLSSWKSRLGKPFSCEGAL